MDDHETAVGLFDALASQESLRATRRGWVIVRDAIVEIELLGGWLVADRGPRLSQALSTEADLGRNDLGEDQLIVQGQLGTLNLRRVEGLPVPVIRITDRYVVRERKPSGHPDGRPDLALRRG